MKRCYTCKCDKEESEFNRNRSRRDGLHTHCKICSAGRLRKWRQENPEAQNKWRQENPESYRRSQYKKKYGLALEQYNQMLTDQGGVCAICNRPESGRELCVDHDHTTGEVRALLCSSCNKGLGHFFDRADLTSKATDYLLRFTAANQES